MFDPRYQTAPNGPLTKETRDRISAFRSFSTLAEIGEAIGFSPGHTSQILNDKAPANVSSKHMPRIVRAIEEGEAHYAEELGITKPTAPSGGLKANGNTLTELKTHIHAIEALGFKVTALAPL